MTGQAATATAGSALGPAAPAATSMSIEPTRIPVGTCRARDVLDRVGDKWSVYVIALLGTGTQRFTHLLRSIDGISQRMLTVTLRGLERDGIVTRKVYPIVPPRVEYTLTPMGQTLLETIVQLMRWADEHATDIDASRIAYDEQARQSIADEELVRRSA
jgi:DNA-binding HxlR family transcriptional regulator